MKEEDLPPPLREHRAEPLPLLEELPAELPPEVVEDALAEEPPRASEPFLRRG